MSTPAASDQARLRNRLLAAAAGASPVVVFSLDRSGSVTYAEGGALPSLSGGETAVEGRPAAEVWRGSPLLVAAIGQALAGNRVAEDLWIDDRAFAVRLIPTHDSEGIVTGVAGLAVATVREASTPSAGDSFEILGALVDSLPLSVWVLDQRGDVVRENALAREKGTSTVRCARELSPPGHSLVGRVLLNGRDTEGTARYVDSMGERVDLKVRGIPLRNPKGKTVGAVLLAEPPQPPPASVIDPPSTPTTLPRFPWVVPSFEAPNSEVFS